MAGYVKEVAGRIAPYLGVVGKPKKRGMTGSPESTSAPRPTNAPPMAVSGPATGTLLIPQPASPATEQWVKEGTQWTPSQIGKPAVPVPIFSAAPSVPVRVPPPGMSGSGLTPEMARAALPPAEAINAAIGEPEQPRDTVMGGKSTRLVQSDPRIAAHGMGLYPSEQKTLLGEYQNRAKTEGGTAGTTNSGTAFYAKATPLRAGMGQNQAGQPSNAPAEQPAVAPVGLSPYQQAILRAEANNAIFRAKVERNQRRMGMAPAATSSTNNPEAMESARYWNVKNRQFTNEATAGAPAANVAYTPEQIAAERADAQKFMGRESVSGSERRRVAGMEQQRQGAVLQQQAVAARERAEVRPAEIAAELAQREERAKQAQFLQASIIAGNKSLADEDMEEADKQRIRQDVATAQAQLDALQSSTAGQPAPESPAQVQPAQMPAAGQPAQPTTTKPPVSPALAATFQEGATVGANYKVGQKLTLNGVTLVVGPDRKWHKQ